eukprot:5258359-Amphidinium_carterae.1
MFFETSRSVVIVVATFPPVITLFEVQGSSKLRSAGATFRKKHHFMFLHGSRALKVLYCFGLCVNSVAGVLPHSSVVQITSELRRNTARKRLANNHHGRDPL